MPTKSNLKMLEGQLEIDWMFDEPLKEYVLWAGNAGICEVRQYRNGEWAVIDGYGEGSSYETVAKAATAEEAMLAAEKYYFPKMTRT